MPVMNSDLFSDIRLHVAKRLAQHLENLELWESGYLDPTEPDPEERDAVVRELKAAIAELELIQDMIYGRKRGSVTVLEKMEGRE